MRILLIHNFYQQEGGEDLVVKAELKALRSSGAAVRVYSRHSDEIKAFGIVEKLLFPKRAIASDGTRVHLNQVIEEFGPDVAYVHNLFPLISPCVYDVLQEAGIPVVQSIHNFRIFCARADFLLRGEICERCLDGSAWNGVLRKCFRDSYALSATYAGAGWKARQSIGKVSVFLAPSEFVRVKYIQGGVPAHSIVLRPHGVDTRAIRPSPNDGEYALFLGRLAPEKGLLTLLDAFRQLPDVPLVVAGMGPLEDTLRQHVARNHLRNVRFAGFQRGQAKWDLIARAKFLVFPSECYETFGMPILEGYAMGKAAIGSNIGSIPCLIEDGRTGLLFEPGSSEELAARVRRLFDNPLLSAGLGQAGRKLAEERYDARANFDLLMRVFEGVISGTPEPLEMQYAEAVS